MKVCPVCAEVYPWQATRCRSHDITLEPWDDLGDAPTGTHPIGELTDPEVPLYAAPTPAVVIDPALVAAAPMVRPSRRLGKRYRLEDRLGLGGYGAVFAAHDERLDKRVAVKVLSPALTHDAAVMRRFRREAIAASSVRHECVVDITDHDIDPNGTSYIVMEYLDGRDLCQVLAIEGRLETTRALAIAVQCASALTAVHAANILHRDLKPSNLFLVRSASRREAVKIIDFGIAKILAPERDESSVTSASKVVGTPFYMAPEQARGQELDGRVDVYSLGVILFEMLTGERPFTGTSALEIIAEAMTRERVPPSRLRPELAAIAGLDELVIRALAVERADRHASMREFGDAVVACLAGIDRARLANLPAIVAAPATPREQSRTIAGEIADPTSPSTLDDTSGELTRMHPLRRHRRSIAAVGALVIAAMLGSVLLLRGDDDGGGERALATPIVPAVSTAPAHAIDAAPAPTPPTARIERDVSHDVHPTPPSRVSPSTPAPPRVPSPIARATVVRIVSVPTGATVSSGARTLGVTPLDVHLARDERATLRLSYPGYAPRSLMVDRASDREVHVALVSRPPTPPPPPPPAAPGIGIKDW